MVGQERAVLPLLAERDYGIASKSAMLSFIATFGLVKALANLAAGHFADRIGRRRLLVLGWLVGLPVPLLLIFAPSWGWIVFANVLLGINQGLCWSLTVIMKIDLVGPERRGLAMGLNEFAGYLAVSIAALLTGYLASAANWHTVPFYPGIAYAVLGTLLSVLFVRETRDHAVLEGEEVRLRGSPSGAVRAVRPTASPGAAPTTPSFSTVFMLTSWKDRTLFAVSQAGMVNNLNDGVMWGLVPVLLASAQLPVQEIALVAAVYPGIWSVAQLATGPLSDRWGRKRLIVGGMWVQAAAILLFVAATGFTPWMAGATLLGIGTAMVYPTLIAAVSDVAHPDWRASAVGVYRLWRDGGYVVGALGAGLLADALGLRAAILGVALLTLASGFVAAGAMRETLPARRVAA
ncbi:MAG: MFS transporter [Gemmatimonadetes bacterium]|nr:MFS transporter [Gemmatimonadota bacterium]